MKYTQYVKRMQKDYEEEIVEKEDMWKIVDFLCNNNVLFQANIYIDKQSDREEGSQLIERCRILDIDKEKESVFILISSQRGTSLKYWLNVYDLGDISVILDTSGLSNLNKNNFIDADALLNVVF